MDTTFKNSAVWLAMLKQGGRWTAAEVGALIGTDQSAAGTALRSMSDFGTVHRWDRSDTNDRVRYGVTADCKVPRGVAVKDIAEALR
jgi:predicted transcriptional regulator